MSQAALIATKDSVVHTFSVLDIGDYFAKPKPVTFAELCLFFTLRPEHDHQLT
jgi:hypothetical protein